MRMSDIPKVNYNDLTVPPHWNDGQDMLGFGELFQYTNSHFRNTHIFAGDILPWFGTPLLAESLGAPFDSLRQRYLQQTNENTDMKQVNSTRSFGCS